MSNLDNSQPKFTRFSFFFFLMKALCVFTIIEDENRRRLVSGFENPMAPWNFPDALQILLSTLIT